MDKMQKAFRSQVKEALKHIPESGEMGAISKIGAEHELFLYRIVGDKKVLATNKEKLTILETMNDANESEDKDVDYELGASVIELNPGPVNLNEVGFGGWWEQLSTLSEQLTAVAGKNNLLVGRNGTIDWVPTTGIVRTEAEKYILVPDYHDNNRKKSPSSLSLNGLEMTDAGAVGILNSFQFTLESHSIKDALDKLNRLLMICPMAVALFANASRLNGRYTGWEDVRYEVWRRTHDTREPGDNSSELRIGLPKDYYNTFGDYINDICKFPFISKEEKKALGYGFGLCWRDVRIKFDSKDNKNLLVEFRPLSTQHTLKKEITAAAFVVGRLAWSQFVQEDLVPMENVRANKFEAEKNGMCGKYDDGLVTLPYRQTLGLELAAAKRGLKHLGLPESLGIKLLDEEFGHLLES